MHFNCFSHSVSPMNVLFWLFICYIISMSYLAIVGNIVVYYIRTDRTRISPERYEHLIDVEMEDVEIQEEQGLKPSEIQEVTSITHPRQGDVCIICL